jgi:hypothetical protein
MTDTPVREATDDEVIGWAADDWLTAMTGDGPGHNPEDEHVQITEGLPEAESLFNDAVAAARERGAHHLISQVFLWVYVDTHGDVAGVIVTVDLPGPVRIASEPQDSLLPDIFWQQGMNIRELYRELIGNVTAIARSIISDHHTPAANGTSAA